jgi:hypothetical protein
MAKPLETYSYTLTKADALVWEMLPREIVGWRLGALLAVVALGALLMALLPADLIGAEFSLQYLMSAAAIFGVLFALTAAAMTQQRYARATRRVPVPQPVVLEVWPDQLVTLTDGAERSIRFSEIGKVLLLPTHVMLALREGPVIVPRLAFASDAGMASFGARMEQASRAASGP